MLRNSSFNAHYVLKDYVFPTEARVDGIALVISGDEYYGMYPEDIALLAGERGFKAVIMSIDGSNIYSSSDLDESVVASVALRFWRNAKASCVTPVYFIPGVLGDNIWKVNASTFGAVLETGNVLHVAFHVNTEAIWLKTGNFIGGILVPGVLMAYALGILALFKLWKKGAPYSFNAGVIVMYLGFTQAIIFGVVVSDSVRRAPNLSYTALYTCVTLFVLASVLSTFLIGFYYL
jgi:hypothetical protein